MDNHREISATIETDRTSAKIADVRCVTTLANRTGDLPNSLQKQKRFFLSKRKTKRHNRKTITPPQSPAIQHLPSLSRTPSPILRTKPLHSHLPLLEPISLIDQMTEEEYSLELFNTKNERVAIAFFYHIGMKALP